MSKNLGDAFVRVRPNTDGFAKEAESGMSGGLKKMAGLIAGVFASRAAIQGANALVGKASDLNETVNKSNIIFGKNAGMIRNWAKNSATNLGLPETAALSAAASFGDMFTQIGFASKASARMSKSTIQMAADLGSFNNLETDDVLNRISAALRGEYDSLQAVIPNINAARVEQVALAKTGKDAAKALTAQEKAAATLAIINKDGARAAGDFGRTQDGLANSNKAVAAQFENLKTRIGSGLLPIWQTVSGVLRTEVLPPLMSLADKWVPKIAAAISGWVSSGDPGAMMGRIGAAVRGIDWGSLGESVSKLGDAGRDLGPAFKEASSSLPSLTDLIDVASVVLKFAADNVDLLAKALPYLAAGFVAVKVAQSAANVAAAASPAIRLAEVFATRAQTAAIRQQTAALAGSSVAQVQNGVVTGVTTKMTIRQRIAALASAAAQKVIAAATKAWAIAQRVLNAAMRANPIGLVITALVALVGGLVLAYKKSETFRKIVDKAFAMVKGAARSVGNFFVKKVPQFFSDAWNKVSSVTTKLVGGYIKFVTFIPRKIASGLASLTGKLRDIFASAFNAGKDKVVAIGGKILDWISSIPGKIGAFGSKMGTAGKALLQSFIDGMKNAAGIIKGIAGNVWDAVRGLLNGAIGKINSAVEFTIDLPGPKNLTVNPPDIPQLAKGGIVRRPTLAVVGEDGPEAVVPLSAKNRPQGMDFGTTSLTVHQHFPTSSDPTPAANAAAARILDAMGG